MLPDIEMEKIVFANGVRLMLYPNPGETNRVYVRVRWGGGYNALPSTKRTPGLVGRPRAGRQRHRQAGAGADRPADHRARRSGMDFGIDEDAFVLGAVSSPADYQDQLRLFADKLAAPGWDPAPIARAKALIATVMPGSKRRPTAC